MVRRPRIWNPLPASDILFATNPNRRNQESAVVNLINLAYEIRKGHKVNCCDPAVGSNYNCITSYASNDSSTRILRIRRREYQVSKEDSSLDPISYDIDVSNDGKHWYHLLGSDCASTDEGYVARRSGHKIQKAGVISFGFCIW